MYVHMYTLFNLNRNAVKEYLINLSSLILTLTKMKSSYLVPELFSTCVQICFIVLHVITYLEGDLKNVDKDCMSLAYIEPQRMRN